MGGVCGGPSQLRDRAQHAPPGAFRTFAATTLAVGLALALALSPVAGSSAEALPAPRQPVSTASVGALPAFRVGGYRPVLVEERLQPFAGSRPPRRDTLPHDAAGVRKVRVAGALRDHPVAQATYGLENLERYRTTRDAFFLRRAVAQADRLIRLRVPARGGWFYPYRFRFSLHGGLESRPPPWFSAMAQGRALSLFTRLYETTRAHRWRVAADATFRSFLLPPAGQAPWVVQVVRGDLWLEEYPAPAAARSDFTLNGHIFASVGLYDYWALTRSAAAAELFDGAAATVARRLPQFRRPGWRSVYCLEHRVDAGKYHAIHVNQMLVLHLLAGNSLFARLADQLRDDSTLTTVPGRLRMTPGRVIGRRFDPRGRVLSTRTVTLSATSSASTDRREPVLRHGVQLRVSAGPLAGFWVSEVPGRVFRLGPYAGVTYRRSRQAVVVRTGTVIGFASRLTQPSAPVARAVLPRGAALLIDRSSYLDGGLFVHVTSAPLAGAWVRTSQLVPR